MHPHSPTWHRSARRQRHKARARVHKCRAQGISPFARDLSLLARHHSRPSYRELSKHMGKKPQAGTEWWSQGQYPQQPRQPHWSYWGGSWAARSSRPESMRYDAVHIDENSWQNGGYPTAPPEEETPDSRRRKAIQKALTNAKKQDQKVRKVRSSLLANSSNGRFLPSR